MTQHSRHLLVLRHAKSDWNSGADSDFDRPLAKRGIKDAPLMGRWMKKHNIVPGYIVSSPALRAKQTIEAVAKELGITKDKIHFDDNIYAASLNTLLNILAACPKASKSILLVGHNPGLDDLVEYLCGNELGYTKSGKLMTTAALAQIAMPEHWDSLPRHCAGLIAITRPKELK
jgi:phosphohistidine phosphatase